MKPAKKVLLIDDDVKLVKLLKESLQQEGYNVYCLYDGASAASTAQRYKPDLILMDVNMPNVSGFKAFEDLRVDPKTAHIPIVFITELTSQVLYPIVQFQPNAAHLKKPLDLVDLNSFIRQFLDKTPAS